MLFVWELPIYTGVGSPGKFVFKLSCQLEVSLAAGAFSGNLMGSIGFSDELCVSEGELLIKCKSVKNIWAQFNR